MALHGTQSSGQLRPILRMRELPLVGSLPGFMRERLDLLLRMAQEGDACRFHIGPVPVLFLNRPEHVEAVLVDRAGDFSKGRLMHRAASGNGLFISEGELHRRQRRLMAPAFVPRRIAEYAQTITRYAEQVQSEWPEGAVVDLNQEMTRLTMSIIGKVLFDADVFSEADELGAAMATMFAHVAHVLSSVVTPPLAWPTPHNRRTVRATRLVEDRLRAMIEQRRGDPTSHGDLLSLLLQARDDDGHGMDDRQLMDECLTLFAAGHETTAATLTWAWYLLCTHPDVYEALVREVDQALGDRAPTDADLPRLALCTQIFKEALRLYPPAPGILREALRDVEICGYPVPRGWQVMFSPYTLHRRADAFPEPERFDPGRFAPEREQRLPRYAFIPFGAGPRICIGNHLALIEGPLLLAALTRRATFRLVPGQVVEPDPLHHLALRPAGKVEAVVELRA
jgi:cytochrome P450